MINDRFISACFSDGSDEYRSIVDNQDGTCVRVRVRLPENGIKAVWLHVENNTPVEAVYGGNEAGFAYYYAEFPYPDHKVRYCFEVDTEWIKYAVQSYQTNVVERIEERDRSLDFVFTPKFYVPDWSKGAVWYQIFPDRFRSGEESNKVLNREYRYLNGYSRRIKNERRYPGLDDPRCFYGGDIPGILESLDYFQELGVEVLYLNPIFVSPSSHRYDTQDYAHIDPHLTVIDKRYTDVLGAYEKDLHKSERYMYAVASEDSLEQSDRIFAEFCNEVHRRGMKIVLDGVFNHCGSRNRWMDREGIYSGGAYRNSRSIYREFFNFSQSGDRESYEGWWGYDTLPKLNYEASAELCETIFAIAEKWLKPPYCIDGWRLDVAADLGHSSEFNHWFWKEFRNRVRGVNEEALIIAEHYGDPGDWLDGSQWDTVMNYDAFMEPVSFFLTGMEKHSDWKNETLIANGEAYLDTMLRNMARMDQGSIMSAMNELSNHDHSRFMTRTNGTVGRTQTIGPKAAETGIRKDVFMLGVVMQFTWPGAPTIYYGDEAGLCGWTDPDNRRFYPWGREDQMLVDLHRKMALMRKAHPVLRNGHFKAVYCDNGVIGYIRFDSSETVLIMVSREEYDTECVVPLDAVYTEGSAVCKCIAEIGNDKYELFEDAQPVAVSDHSISVIMPGCSAKLFMIECSE